MAHELTITVERDGRHFVESSVEPGKVLEGPFNTAKEALQRSESRSNESEVKRPIGVQFEKGQRPVGARFADVTPSRTEASLLPAPARRFLRGFNDELATLIGVPVELIDQGLRLAGKQLLEQPGDAVETVRGAFNAIGIDTGRLDSFADNIGRGFFQGTLLLLGGAGAAPILARGAQQVGPITRAGAELTKAIVTRPGVAVAAEVGGVTGAEAAAEITPDPFKPFAALGGGLLGGMAAGGIVAARPRRTPELPPEDALPIRREGQPEAARSRIGERLTRRLETLDRLIDRTIDRFARLDPDDVSAAGKREIETAFDTARNMQRALWRDVPKRVKIGFDNAGSAMDDLLRNTPTAQRADIPNIARRILLRKRIDPTTGSRIRIKQISARELQGLRSNLLETARTARSRGKRNKARIASELAEAILLDMNTANIDVETFNAARAFSNRFNDIFFRTGAPIGRVLRLTPQGGETVSARVTMERLLRDPEGPQAIRTLAEQPEFGRRELIVKAEDALRADFGERATAGRTPVKLSRQRRALREFPEVARELVEANDLIRRTLTRRRELERGALARFTEADPQVAISRLIASTDPAGNARRLVGTLQGDQTALQGLRTGIIEELWRSGGGDARGFARLLVQPKTERLIQTVLSPQELRRLNNITAAATDISTVRQSIVRTILTSTGRIGFRIGGAQVGRQLAGVTGGGTVQTPGLVSRAASQTFDRLFIALPPEELLARAIVDSRWERTILSRAPKDLPEVRELLRRMRQFLGVEAGARTAADEEGPPIPFPSRTERVPIF